MPFEIKQEKFEGPLELLLELIENQKFSISEVSLAAVTDDFLRHVRGLARIDPEILSDFLVIAAQLMLIKSRTLLPSLAYDKEEEASIDELEGRLIEYKRIRELAQGLKRLEARNMRIYTRDAYVGMEVVFYPPPGVDGGALASAFRNVLALLPKFEKMVEDKMRRIISLEERIRHIRAALTEKLEQKFSELISGAKEKVDVIVSFLAILELARGRIVDLDQAQPFEDIVIKRL